MKAWWYSGNRWYIRGINTAGDFCYVTPGTVKFYLKHCKGKIDYQMQADGTLTKSLYDQGLYHLIFQFIRGDGTCSQWNSVLKSCQSPSKYSKFMLYTNILKMCYCIYIYTCMCVYMWHLYSKYCTLKSSDSNSKIFISQFTCACIVICSFTKFTNMDLFRTTAVLIS